MNLVAWPLLQWLTIQLGHHYNPTAKTAKFLCARPENPKTQHSGKFQRSFSSPKLDLFTKDRHTAGTHAAESNIVKFRSPLPVEQIANLQGSARRPRAKTPEIGGTESYCTGEDYPGEIGD